VSAATVIAVLIGGLFFLFVRTWNLNGRGPQPGLGEIPLALVMFAAAMAGSVGAGWIAFQAGIFRFDQPSAQVFTTGALMAGVLTLTRIGKIAPAVILSAAWVLFLAGTVTRDSWFRVFIQATWAVVLAIGILLIALIWELLARRGIRLGKFLLAGPLLGGIYMAASPVMFLQGISPNSVMRSLLLTFILGIVIGDGVGLGVELVELFRKPPAPRPVGEVGG
jgi:hypothetical protein